MGATDFQTYAYGKTAQEAFRAAQEHARYEYGHGGYTGTIAEKRGFIHFDTGGLRPLAFLKLLEEAQEYLYSDLNYEVRSAQQHGVGKRKRWMGKTLKQWEAERDREGRKADRFWARVERRKAGLRKLVERAQDIYEDKWGESLCFGPITGKAEADARGWAVGTFTDGKTRDLRKRHGAKLWLFTGIASE